MVNSLHSQQKVTAGIDVHRMLLVVTVPIEQEDGTVRKERRQFCGIKHDQRGVQSKVRLRRGHPADV